MRGIRFGVWGILLLIGILLSNWTIGQTVSAPPPRSHWHIDGESSRDHPAHPNVLSISHRGAVVCTGTLIAEDVDLTARHCVGARDVGTGVMGKNPTQRRRIIGHASHDAGLDAALLFLDAPLSIEPVLLRTPRDTTSPRDIRIVGYGHDRPEHAGIRRVMDTTAHGWGCRHGSRAVFGCTPGYEMVLPRSKGADTCQGDSGGPLLEPVREKWRVVAITSRSVLSTVVTCGDGGVYVRVDAIRNWIDRVLRTHEQSREKE